MSFFSIFEFKFYFYFSFDINFNFNVDHDQSQWEKRVLKSLNSMCMELGQSLAKPRCQNEQQELISESESP